MNEVLNAIFQRKGIREYKLDPVEIEKIEWILKAGTAAPNARNKQLWHFSAIMNQEIIDEIDRKSFEYLVKEGRRQPEPVYHPVHEPPVLIVISSSSENEFAKEDCSCACQNMALAAYSLGLGSRYLDVPTHAFCHGKDPLKDKCEVPDGYEVICCLCVGYPKEQLPPTEKRQDVISIVR